jgi:anti-sigma factor RsiW
MLHANFQRVGVYHSAERYDVMTQRNDLEDELARCPAAEVLAAYLDHQLTDDERILVERHLVVCNKCRQIVSRAVKANDSVDSPVVDEE